MGDLCTQCEQDIDNVYDIFASIRDSIPRDKHYVFVEYADLKVKAICIECFIKTVVMFQKLRA